jgi:hypothetical protein
MAEDDGAPGAQPRGGIGQQPGLCRERRALGSIRSV